jgi:hypothetical protein
VHDKNRLGQLGFKAVALGRIEDALEDVPAAQPRRTQELAEGSCTDIEAEIAHIYTQLGLLLAHDQVYTQPSTNPAGRKTICLQNAQFH